jgi:hypothetical protein
MLPNDIDFAKIGKIVEVGIRMDLELEATIESFEDLSMVDPHKKDPIGF